MNYCFWISRGRFVISDVQRRYIVNQGTLSDSMLEQSIDQARLLQLWEPHTTGYGLFSNHSKPPISQACSSPLWWLQAARSRHVLLNTRHLACTWDQSTRAYMTYVSSRCGGSCHGEPHGFDLATVSRRVSS